jgi:hypothetical protein
MKCSQEKSSVTASSTATLQRKTSPFFAKVANGGFFSPATGHSSPFIQAKMTVNKPGDKLEKEADTMAEDAMKGKVQRATLPEEKVQINDEKKIQAKSSDNLGTLSDTTQASVQNRTTGGEPLSGDVLSYMEPRFNADFSGVRIHTDKESAGLSNQLSARAFTYQNHLFFSHGEYQPGTSEGRFLLAHELSHTIQQGHSVKRKLNYSTTVTPPHVQRFAAGEILDWIAGKANNIPGFRMFTVILGMNPVNMSAVDRSAANILRALIEFIPGGTIITTALDNHGVFTKVSDWIEKQIKAFGMTGQMFKTALTKFIDSLGASDLLPWKWGSVWERAKSIFTEPINRLISFAKGVIKDILKFIKDAILKPLAALAKGTNGYDLLRAILGEDPIIGEPVPRNADTLIGGFMKLIGQQEIWENIKKGNAVNRAWVWFQGALSGLMGFVRSIPIKILNTLTSLTIQDIVTVAGAFGKIIGTFANIAVDFVTWGIKQVLSLLEILFSVVAPGVMPYIRKAQATFMIILKNPIGFVGNLVRAGRLGFEKFASRIGEHLKTALIKWIVGPLADAGVYIPKSFTLIEIIKLVLSVLGLTWQNIRAKLVKIIPEPVLVGLEKTAGILVTLVRDGPVAAWEQLKAELTELKDQLISQIVQMVTTEVVKAAIIKLVSMLNPAGAVIQAIIAIYNTVTFFIQKINQIAAVVASFIDSISAIAAGQVENAANKVEQTMANTLVIIIAFLAKFAGLGNIPDKVVGIIKKIREPIDKCLDKIVGWLGGVLKKLSSKALGGDPNAPPEVRLQSGLNEAVAAVNKLSEKTLLISLIKPLLGAIRIRHNLKILEAEPRNGKWAIIAEVNPRGEKLTEKLVEEGKKGRKFLSKITYSAVNKDGFGVRMVADPVGPDHLEGTTVSDSLRKELRLDVNRRQGKYRLGHLLNHHIGGPGNDWRNLTPITPKANSDHLHQVETDVKTLINDHKRWVYYEVKPDYSGTAPALTKNCEPLEASFARRLRWKYQLKKEDPNNPNQLIDDPQDSKSVKKSGSGVVESISSGYPD